MDYANDANSVDEVERRKKQFVRWLLSAWEFATNSRTDIAETLADLISHAEEPDYPLWGMAEREGIIGEGLTAHLLRKICGSYPSGPLADDWERFINYSPVIRLDEETWRHIHGQLGWPNRDHDHGMKVRNFYLWSKGGNVVRFVMREEMTDYGIQPQP